MIKTLYPTFQRWSEKGSIYLISDTHFCDSDCKFMDKDWPTPEEHLEKLKKISKQDTVIHLGDVGDPEYMKKIKGYKVLIMGNHDAGASNYEPYFDEVYTGPLIIAEKIILSHEPIDISWAYNIHGHDHCPYHFWDDTHFNCAANVVGYIPISLADLIKTGFLNRISSLHRLTIDDAGKKDEKEKV